MTDRTLRGGDEVLEGRWDEPSDSWDVSAYGERFADVYDEWTSGLGATPVVEFLLRLLPEGGRALELGIGTGRIALPLERAGIEVTGIDASPAMVARLRSKTGSERVRVIMGDFADVDVPGSFQLVFAVQSTLFALLTQEEQIRCLCNVAAHLEAGGHLVIEALVPDPHRYVEGQSVRFVETTPDGPRLDVEHHDPVDQRLDSVHVILGAEGISSYPVHLRYAWPAELDAMALAAGLEPLVRYADFDREPFTGRSASHVSVYRRGSTGSEGA